MAAGRRAEQCRALQRGGGHLILGEKLRSQEPAIQEALRRPGRYQKVRDNLEVKEITVAEGSERRCFVLVRNPAEKLDGKYLLTRLQALRPRLAAGVPLSGAQEDLVPSIHLTNESGERHNGAMRRTLPARAARLPRAGGAVP